MKPIAHRALRPIATLEAFKGVIVLVAGFGLLSFLGRDNEAVAGQIVRHLHLNPAHHYPHVFIAAMARVEDSRVLSLTGFAVFYAAVRFVEAYGLWNERRWAEWLAALSGAIYLPLEIFELVRHATWLVFIAFLVNLAVVGYMAWLLTESRRRRTTPATAAKTAGAGASS